VKREDIFITSKLYVHHVSYGAGVVFICSWCTYHNRVSECLDITLSSLGVDYLDLYLVHWPARTVENGTDKLFPVTKEGARNVDWDWDQAETWRQMEEVLASGKVKAIGVSNFSQLFLERLAKTWKVVPAVNQVRTNLSALTRRCRRTELQVELHPYNPQHELKAYCEEKGILLQAYSPLGSLGQSTMQRSSSSELTSRFSTHQGPCAAQDRAGSLGRSRHDSHLVVHR
jgi:glycerol 2-dehydrogenase (NADP+)